MVRRTSTTTSEDPLMAWSVFPSPIHYLPLSTSYTLICYFLCTFDSPSPSLGRKMMILGSRPSNGWRAAAFHPRMVRKPHSFFPNSLPLSLSTSYTLTCYFLCTFDSPSPSLGRKMVILGSRSSNGWRAAVSTPRSKQSRRFFAHFTTPIPEHLLHYHLLLVLHF